MAELDLNDLVRQIEETIDKKLGKAYKKTLVKNLKEVFETKAKPYILGLFLNQYDILASQEESEFGPAVKGKDPSELSKFRHLFVKQITEELDKVKIDEESLTVDVGNRDAWYPPGGPAGDLVGQPETVDFLGFYIDGNMEEFAFITDEQHEIMRADDLGTRRHDYGRFGDGFLIPKSSYIKEKWEKGTRLSFEQVRHPISGQPPFKGFDQIAKTFDIMPFVLEAVEKTFIELFK